MISCSTPSMRKRTTSSLACGSKWMSLAASSTDWAITEFTSLTIGASSVASRMSVSDSSSSSRTSSVISPTSAFDAVDLGDGAEDVLLAGDRRLDREAGDDREVLLRGQVLRVDHGDQQRVVVEEAHRDGAVAARQLLVDVGGRGAVEPGRREVEEADAELLRQRLGEVELRDDAVLEQQLAEPLARLLLAAERALDLLVGDEAHLLEDVAEAQLAGALAAHDGLSSDVVRQVTPR